MADDQAAPSLKQTSSHIAEKPAVEAKLAGEKLFFFRPETAEVYVFEPGEPSKAVRTEIALLDGLLESLGKSREDLAKALQEYEEAQKSNQDLGAKAKVDQALKKEAKSKKELMDQFKELSEANKGSKLMELLPLASNKTGKPLLGGKKFTYVRSSKVANHVRSYKLSNADKPKMEAFLTRDSNGQWKLDKDKLKESFTTLKTKVKVAENTTDLWIPDTWSPSFVDGFNEKAHFGVAADKVSPDAMLTFSGEAHLLRFFGGASRTASSNISVESFHNALAGKGDVGAEYKIKGSLGVNLADGKLDANIYLPKAGGAEAWIRSHKDLTLGHFRLRIQGELRGSCGASVLGEGGIEFKLCRDGSKQGIKGAAAVRTAAGVTAPKMNVKEGTLEAKMDAGGDITAFAGAEGEASIEGGVEWQQPEETEWGVIAKIKPALAGQAGAGATACFHITYEREAPSNKPMFRLKAKLGACVGVGLKGEVLASVGVAEIIQFALWFKHQVVNAMDQNLGYFDKDAFTAFCQMCTLAILEERRLIDYVGVEAGAMQVRLRNWIDKNGALLAKRIQEGGDQLVNSIAEVKGYLLFQLKSLEQLEKNLGDEVRKAIKKITDSAYLGNELQNVFQFASADFTKLPGDQSATMVAWADNLTGDSVMTQMALKKVDPTPGYKLVASSSIKYQFNDGTHPKWQRETMMAPDDNQHMVAAINQSSSDQFQA